jgi:hypothetical protein
MINGTLRNYKLNIQTWKYKELIKSKNIYYTTIIWVKIYN